MNNRDQLDARDYIRRAQQNKPNDPTRLANEIRRLRSVGLSPFDIAFALRLDLGVVLSALRPSAPPQSASPRNAALEKP